jgi:phage-related protein
MKDLIRQKKEDAVYTQEDADAIKAYNVEMGKVKKGFMGIMGVLFRSVLPAFTMVTKYVGQFVNFLRKHQTAIKAFFAMVSALVLGMLLPAFMTFARALMTNPITWVILALAALAMVIEDLIVWMDGGDSALERFWESLFGDRENAKKVFEDMKKSLLKFLDALQFVFEYIMSGRAWQDMKDHAETAIQLIKDKWQIFMRNLKQGWDNFKRNAMAPFRAIARGIDNIRLGWSQFTADLKMRWSNVTNTIAETWQWVQDTIAEGWQWLSDSISEILTWIQTKAAEAWQWVQDKCQEALDWVIKKWNEFKTTALDAINSLFAPINAIAEAIRNVIGGAIDWAITKWQNLKAMVGAGEVFSQADMSYLGFPSGGNTTNNNSSSVSVGEVHVHGVQNGAQFGRQLSAIQYGQSNGGGM